MNPLLDNDFLIKLNNDRNRVIYARIISLNQYEYPIEQLEGVVTAGSISIDGQSAVRRTCSLTLSAKNLNINNVYWGISTKIKIEIGLQNNILGYEKYGNIIWFKQGVFILTDFKTSQAVNNYTINLTGKDKMCLLNGDIAGAIPAPTIFDSYTDQSEQRYTIGETGKYNNFQDEDADKKILEGFQNRHGSDYSYIRNVKKIISLQYKPVQAIVDKEDVKATIQFNSLEEIRSLKDFLSDSANDKGYYDINLDERSINGFIVDKCNEGDVFSWEIEQKIPIAIIIQELLHQYGQERYSNIIIKNIEPYALEMFDNASDETLYLLNDGLKYTHLINQTTLINNYKIYPTTKEKKAIPIKVNEFGEISNLIFEKYVGEDNISLIEIDDNNSTVVDVNSPTTIKQNNNSSQIYTVKKIDPEDTIGYGMTLLVYPDELKANPGDSVTSILDKIVNMLGNYEYFYNLEGQFIFQMKPAYSRIAWNGTIYLNNENYITPNELLNSISYVFDNAKLTTSYQNSPQMNNIKNDFIIWGERKQKDQTIKFHGRYAIENVPTEYTDFNGYTWVTKEKDLKKKQKVKNISGKERTYALDEVVDWRQLISVMADDWYQHHMKDDYEIILRQNNYWPDLNIDLFPWGKTGYEQFYLDLSTVGGLWTSLYNANYIKYLYVKKHSDLLNTVYKNGVYDKDSQYSYLFNIYDKEICQKNKYGQKDKHTKISVLSNEVEFKDNKYYLTIVVKDENSKNYLNEELIELFQYTIRKVWEKQYPTDDKGNKDEINYKLICEIRPSLIIDKIIKEEDSFIFQLINLESIEEPTILTNNISKLYADITIFNNSIQYYQDGKYKYWNKNIIENPELLIFWFDFFQADAMGIGKFATSVIGDRPKTINDTSIKTIIYRDTPDTIYCSWDEYLKYKDDMVLKDGYSYIIIDNSGKGYPAEELDLLFKYQDLLQQNQSSYLKKIQEMGYNTLKELQTFLKKFSQSMKQDLFIRSVRGKSVHEQAEEMLYQYSHYNDSVNINTIPIYYLQPNTMISIKDELSNIIGYYIMNKINLSLSYNGTMSLTAIKYPERIY